jgi:PAS domain S-box-containing protein
MSSPSESLESLRLRIAALEAENSRLREVESSHRRFENELPAAEMLAAVIRASPLAIVALTSKGNVQLWNAAAERLFGWTANEVLGKPLPFIPQERMEEHQMMRARDLAGEGFSGREIRRMRKDGSPVDVSVSTAPVRNERNQVIGIMRVYVDITERKAAEDWAYQQAELLEQAYDAVLVWDIEGVIVYWNRAATDLYGYSKEEAIGRVSYQFLGTQTVAGPSLLNELRANRRWSGELVHSTRDGRRIVVESRQVVVRSAKGTDVVLETNRDVTERVRAEREIKAANTALRRANSDLEQFAYAAAHDLQEPLRNMAIFAQLLKRRYYDILGQDGREFADTVVGGAQRMQALVNDLLVYTQTVQDEQPGSRTADAPRVLEDVLKVLTAGNLPVIPVSSTHLAQLLQNLITNAIKYRRPEVAPRIHIAAFARSDEMLLSVADNGQGIPPEYRERVFGLFRRLHPEQPGTGLGLAICKRVTESYGGRIWIADSKDGVGTTVWIALPEH